MTVLALTDFFKWCAVLGGVLYMFSAAAIILVPKFIYKTQSWMFGLKEETLKIVLYAYMAIFKVLYLLFILVPYLALLMTAK